MKTNKPGEEDKSKKSTASKKQVTVKQGETILGKIRTALGDIAAKIKTFLRGKSEAVKKRSDSVSGNN